MKYVGIDLRTNRFTCCYLSDNSRGKQIETFNLDTEGLFSFFATVSNDTYILVEAAINTFAFTALFKDLVKEVIAANTYQLKSVGLPGKKTGKLDAAKLAEKLKAQVVSGVQQIIPASVPPKGIRDIRALFATYRVLRKEIGRVKNRMHSLLKENLYPFTKEYIFSKKTRSQIRVISTDYALSPFMRQIDILTSMPGISVVTALAVVADVIEVSRFGNAKHFTSYLRGAPRVESSNDKTAIKSTSKAGRKLSITLLSQSLNHFRDENKKLNRWYEHFKAYKKKGIVRMALCRKVFCEIYQMLKKKEYHYFRNPVLHEKKMSEYRKFLIKEDIVFSQEFPVDA